MSSIVCLAACPVHAEIKQTWPELPSFTPETKPVGSILPQIKLPSISDTQGIRSGRKFTLQGFQFSGNRILSDQQLGGIVKNYINKSISISELFKIRDKITQEYIRLGYLSSGAQLPDQQVTNGIIRFNITEGKLADVRVKTDGRLNSNYVATPLRRSATPVVNVFKLEERLQLLQQDIRINTIDARLEPTDTQGEAILDVKVNENSAYDFRVEVNNHASPNVGAEGIKFTAQHDNLTGSGNQLVGNLEKTEGLSRFSLNYSQPFVESSTSVDVFASVSESVIVDDNFKSLDIKDQSQSFRVSLRESKISNIDTRVDWYISAYYQHGATFLKGEPFSFGDPRDDGEIDLTGFSFGSDWISRSKNQVMVIGVSSSVGILIPDDDDDDDIAIDPNGPDGKSLIVNGHLQWARKLNFLNARMFSRFDLQLSNSALYGVQQFSLGGHASVRGYRENLIVRDNGALGSMELRIPVYIESGTKISLVGFAEGGRAWQTARKNNGPSIIASLGGGIMGSIKKKTHFNIYFAKALRDIDYLGESNLQDYGIHFSISSSWR